MTKYHANHALNNYILLLNLSNIHFLQFSNISVYSNVIMSYLFLNTFLYHCTEESKIKSLRLLKKSKTAISDNKELHPISSFYNFIPAREQPHMSACIRGKRISITCVTFHCLCTFINKIHDMSDMFDNAQ